MKMESRKIQWLANVVMIMVGMGACTSEEQPTLPLSQVLVDTWQPKSYISDPLVGWRKINESNELTEVSITNDTIRTGAWITDPWVALEANERLYRRDKTDNDNSVWIQCGVQHMILEKMSTN